MHSADEKLVSQTLAGDREAFRCAGTQISGDGVRLRLSQGAE